MGGDIMSQENCPKCPESLQTKDHSPGLKHSRQKISIHFCNSCAYIGLEIQGYLFSEHDHTTKWNPEINNCINEEILSELASCKCSNEDCETGPGYYPTFHSELTTKGIEIHSILCGKPDCVGVIKQFQNKLIPYTSDKEKFEEVDPNQNPAPEQFEQDMKQKGSIADIAHRKAPFRSKSIDIPDDKHQREH
jgi:hypothetical protein